MKMATEVQWLPSKGIKSFSCSGSWMAIRNDPSCLVSTVESLKIFHKGGAVLIVPNNVTIIKKGKDKAIVKIKISLEW